MTGKDATTQERRHPSFLPKATNQCSGLRRGKEEGIDLVRTPQGWNVGSRENFCSVKIYRLADKDTAVLRVDGQASNGSLDSECMCVKG